MIHIKRTEYLPDCTLGIMTIGSFACYTIERPWLGNKPRISCIPKGTYKFVPHGWEDKPAVKFKKVWRLLSVPGRSAILIHSGNTSDDVIGCIAVGAARGMLKGKHAVIESRVTLEKIRNIIGNNSGTVVIE